MGESRNRRPKERLLQTSILGPMLEKDNAVRFDAVRLEQSRAAIHNRILNLESRSEDQSPVVSYHLGGFSLRRYAVIAAVATLIISAGASAYLIYKEIVEDRDAEQIDIPEESPTKEAPRRERSLKSTTSPIERDSDTAKKDDVLEQESSTSMSPLPRRSKVLEKMENDTPPEPSRLDEQLAIFRRAKQQATRGHHEEALKILAELDGQYPNGSLGLESRELRAKSLYNMGRYADAAVALENLIRAPVSAGKKAQFFRLLGDARAREGR